MRDSERIDIILSKIKILWETKYPDLRFFQLCYALKFSAELLIDQDPFFLEDGDLEKFLDLKINENKIQ